MGLQGLHDGGIEDLPSLIAAVCRQGGHDLAQIPGADVIIAREYRAVGGHAGIMDLGLHGHGQNSAVILVILGGDVALILEIPGPEGAVDAQRIAQRGVQDLVHGLAVGFFNGQAQHVKGEIVVIPVLQIAGHGGIKAVRIGKQLDHAVKYPCGGGIGDDGGSVGQDGPGGDHILRAAMGQIVAQGVVDGAVQIQLARLGGQMGGDAHQDLGDGGDAHAGVRRHGVVGIGGPAPGEGILYRAAADVGRRQAHHAAFLTEGVDLPLQCVVGGGRPGGGGQERQRAQQRQEPAKVASHLYCDPSNKYLCPRHNVQIIGLFCQIVNHPGIVTEKLRKIRKYW